jgi:hypothetical protein
MKIKINNLASRNKKLQNFISFFVPRAFKCTYKRQWTFSLKNYLKNAFITCNYKRHSNEFRLIFWRKKSECNCTYIWSQINDKCHNLQENSPILNSIKNFHGAKIFQFLLLLWRIFHQFFTKFFQFKTKKDFLLRIWFTI